MQDILAMQVCDILQAAAEWLSSHELVQGCFGLGLYKSDAPKPGKSWPKPHDVYPWDIERLHELRACSALGALCYVCASNPDAPLVQSAIDACLNQLRKRGIEWSLEVWNDKSDTTTEDVVLVMLDAARQLQSADA